MAQRTPFRLAARRRITTLPPATADRRSSTRAIGKEERTMATKKRVGFIGVGLMGHGMAKNIVEKGYDLTILGHRNRAPVEDLVGRGAVEAKNAAEVARRSDLVFLCVTGSPQVEAIVFGKDGLLEGLAAGAIVADSSTAEPESTLKIAAAIASRGGRFVDTPLVRTPKEAEEGRLGVMTGGDPATLAEIRPVLETFAENIVHAGPLGAGHKLKLVNNFLVMAVAGAIAEAVATAKRAGIDLKALSDIVTGGGADSVMFRRFSKYFLEGDDTAAKFSLSNAAKDMRYYTHMMESIPAAGFITAAVHQTFQLANLRGHGAEFLPHIIDAVEEMNDAKAG
jgi:3-hydroxyisobutyrate dehydrogenase-like beta-hydroxyacid dehydrogenase